MVNLLFLEGGGDEEEDDQNEHHVQHAGNIDNFSVVGRRFLAAIHYVVPSEALV